MKFALINMYVYFYLYKSSIIDIEDYLIIPLNLVLYLLTKWANVNHRAIYIYIYIYWKTGIKSDSMKIYKYEKECKDFFVDEFINSLNYLLTFRFFKQKKH